MPSCFGIVLKVRVTGCQSVVPDGNGGDEVSLSCPLVSLTTTNGVLALVNASVR